MKLVSIELSDVRRFVAPVRIDGFGPGLNVLSAPNEQGKSTLFDALQALFLQPHRTTAKEVKALRPHGGGGPTVAVEIDLPDGRYRVVKRWLQRAEASVWRDGQRVATSDEAEAFLARLMASEGEGGPAGLLWVRQGLTQLEDAAAGAGERAKALAARRGLMSSVAGEVDSLTGGRRMDRALARVREDLARYLTPTGRPAKGGPLALAETAVEELALRETALAATAARLDQALARRRELRRQIGDLTAPEAVAGRRQRLDEAEARLAEAKRHAERREAAALRRGAAEAAAVRAAERLAELARLRDAAREGAEAAERLTGMAALARTALAAAEAAVPPAAAALEAARLARRQAEARQRAALMAEAARAAAARRQELAVRLDQARGLAARRAGLAAAAGAGPDAKAMAALEAHEARLELARAAREAEAPKVTFRHAGAARVLQGGVPVADGAALAVTAETVFDLPGLGQAVVSPGRGGGGDAVARAEAELAAALARQGLASLAAAREAAAARAAAETALRGLEATLRALAPEGLTALEAAFAALLVSEAAGEAPDPAEAAEAVRLAERAEARADEALRLARDEADRRREAEIRATVTADQAQAQAARAAAALAALGDAAAREVALRAEAAEAEATRDRAAAEEAALAADAPDLDAAQAARTRAAGVVRAAEEELQACEREAAGLDAEIDLRAGEGVQEDLADCSSRLLAARAQRDRLVFEVEVLKELGVVLEGARNAARDRYLEPVMAELEPLLRALWPDAALRFDDESLLPVALARAGQEEDLSVLSGGTQEQVALLVRLAFARLLARRGRHAPLILDDALVFTDDDRIETMFDTLHRLAADQQILVLSCRQRVFRDLGGTRLMFRPVSPA